MAVGFGIFFVFILILGGMAYTALTGVSSDLRRYFSSDDASRTMAEMAPLFRNLEVAVRDYIAEPVPDTQVKATALHDQLDQHLVAARAAASDGTALEQVHSALDEYWAGFTRLAASRTDLDKTLNDVLYPVTEQMRLRLEQALNRPDINIVRLASGTAVNVMLMRDYTSRFLDRHQEEDAKRVRAELSLARARLQDLVAALPPSPSRDQMAEVGSMLSVFATGFDKAADLVNQADGVVSAVIEPKGVQIATLIGEIHQRPGNPGPGLRDQLAGEARQLAGTTLIAALLCATTGLVAAWLIGRSITRPYQALSNAIRALSEDRLDTAIPAAERSDEFGEMARALVRYRDLRQDNDTRQAERDKELEAKAQRLRLEADRMRDRENAAREERLAMRDDQERLRQERQKLRTEQEALAQEARRLSDEGKRLAAWDARLRDEEQRIQAEHDRISGEDARQKQAAAQIRLEEERWRTASEQFEVQREEIAEQTARLKLARDTIADHEARLQAEEARLEAEAERLRLEEQHLQEEAKRLAATQERLDGIADDQATEWRRLDGEAEALRTQAARLTTEAEHLASERTRLDAEARSLREEADRLRDEENRLHDETSRLAREEERLDAENDRLAGAWERLRGENENRQAAVERLHAEEQRLLAEGTRLKAEADRLAKEAVGLHEESQRIREEYRKIDARVAGIDAAEDTANRARAAFLDNLGRKLRAPVNAIIGYSQVVLDDIGRLKAWQLAPDVEMISWAGEQLLNAIDTGLELARIELGKPDLALRSFDVTYLVDQVRAMIEPLAELNGNTLIIDCPHDIGNIRSDFAKLQIAVLNLLDNACKYTENGEVHLKVERFDQSGRASVRFIVSDNGRGLGDEQKAKLFEPFNPRDGMEEAPFGGSGLGLPTSMRFCTLLGGAMTVDSIPGKGSTFVITVPSQNEEPAEQPTAPPASPSSAEDNPDRICPVPPRSEDL